jgi:hypothetical protein
MNVMPDRRTPRKSSGARAVVATVEIVAFSAVAHSAAGGAVPGVDLLVALAATVGMVSLALRHRLLSFHMAACVAVAAQPVLHAVFAAGGSHGGHAAYAAPDGLDGSMVLAHGLSAVATVLALRWQEQVLVDAVRCLVRLLSTGLPPLQVVEQVPTPAWRGFVRQRHVLVTAPRRGPPVRSPMVS